MTEVVIPALFQHQQMLAITTYHSVHIRFNEASSSASRAVLRAQQLLSRCNCMPTMQERHVFSLVDRFLLCVPVTEHVISKVNECRECYAA